MKKVAMILLLGTFVSGCSQEFVDAYNYRKSMENRPRSWSAAGESMERAKDFHMWRMRQRCKRYYSFECLERDIHGDRQYIK